MKEKQSYWKKWDVLWVDFPQTGSRVIAGMHPAVVISNNRSMEKAPTFLAIPGSTNLGEGRPNFGQVVVLPDRRVGLNLPTRFDCGRILTVDKDWVRTRAGSVEGTQHKSAFNVELARTLELVEEKHFLGEET